MQYFLKHLAKLVAVFVVGWSCLYWIVGYQQQPLDPDEVVWVLDAEVAARYFSSDWNFFLIDTHHRNLAWSDPQKRIIDQPQLGKILIGSILLSHDLWPWESEQKQALYQQFQVVELPSGTLESLRGVIDQEIIESILLIRWWNTMLSLLVFAVFCALVGRYLQIKKANNLTILLSQVLLFSLLTHNQVIRQFYRLAIVNPYSFFFHIIAVSVILLTVCIVKKKPTSRVFLLLAVLTGTSTAAATSVKLNGSFLLFSVWLGFTLMIAQSRNQVTQFAQKVSWLGMSLCIAGLTFFLLEPELWLQPLFSLQQLLGSRLFQQAVFSQAFESLSVFERLIRVFATSLALPAAFMFILLTTLTTVFLFKLENLWSILKKVIAEHLSLVMVTAPILFGVMYYGEVGFARYFIPATVVVYIWSVVFVGEVFSSSSQNNNNDSGTIRK